MQPKRKRSTPAPSGIKESTLESCLSVLRESEAPLNVSNILKLLAEPDKVHKKSIPEIGSRLEAAGAHKWPPQRGAASRYWHHTVAGHISAVLVENLDRQPLTLALAAGLIKASILSKDRAVVEVKTQLLLLEELQVRQQVLADKKIWYFSKAWAQRLADASPVSSNVSSTLSSPSFKDAIVRSIEALESGPGNYVPVYKLRLASGANAHFDRQIVELADENRLVMTAYNGPRPVPEEQAHDYVQDEQGRLYIGIARPRKEASHA